MKIVLIKRAVCTLILLGGIAFNSLAWGSGFNTQVFDEYLYGPYLNDHPVTEISTDFKQELRVMPCSRKRINTLHTEFFELGMFNQKLSKQDREGIVFCAWKGMKNAYVLLEKVVFADALRNGPDTKDLKAVLYHPGYILGIAKKYPAILRAVPDSHSHYIDLALNIIAMHPHAFDYITLRYKRHPRITKTLFDIQSTYDDTYKHLAIRYAQDTQERLQYIMHNGLLYLELPSEVRQNPYLSYHAYVQNDHVYPYIPKKIKEVFESGDLINVPRRMTRITLMQQSLWRTIKKWTIPIIEKVTARIVSAPNLVVDVESLEDVPSQNVDADSIDFFVDDVPHKNERTVVTNIRLINKIEVMKQRRLLNLWRIATYGDNGQVFVAMFRPDGDYYLGAIVVKYNDRFMFSDYAAIFSMDGESVWRIKDNGMFSAKTFKVKQVVRDEEEQLKISFEWRGRHTKNEFDLVDNSGLLLKEFVNYEFE
jgi:hypothetical protein